MVLLSALMLFVISIQAGASNNEIQRPRRKKVAVVLSGGGAKGVAHVPALKVIEEAGIPIDIVVGTSMGSIVGGLYCSGYTTEQLDSIVAHMNWMRMITDAQDRSEKTLDDNKLHEKYIVSAMFERSPFEVIEGGVFKGNGISKMFAELTADHLDSMDYRKLPIPFACVATDIVSGKEVDMYSGILSESLRASMSLPGVFSPIKKNGKMLVDGGLVNNYPVDIAKAMGADYVIGVDVTDPEMEATEINSTMSVLMRILDVVCKNKYKENVELTDVFIRVNVDGYSSSSFSSVAIDTLLNRGNQAAMAKWDELIALKEKLGRIEPVKPRQPKVLVCDTVVVPPPTIYSEREKINHIGVGARFDTEELATILLGGSYELHHRSRFRVGGELRLGKRYYGEVFAQVAPWRKWMIGTTYRYSSNETKLYNDGAFKANMDYTQHMANLFFRKSWRKMLVSFGTEWKYSNYEALLTKWDWADFAQTMETESSISHFFQIEFDNQDASVMPRRGIKWKVEYNLFTDNGYKYDGGDALHVVEGYLNAAIPLSSRFTLLPSVSGRLVPNRNAHMSNLNYIGGLDTYGHYMPQQLPFAGVNYVQIAPNDLVIGGLNLRHNITENNYIFGQMNYGLAGNAFEKIVTIDSNNLFGAAIGYGYKSPVGPGEINFNWSSITHSLGMFINLGFMF